ncbi:MAG: imidazole glycerol phosphate synthase subunit HisH [Kiritimatiellae bacterium]|nr:imidazole glycerol phosphate synthase subunit HisH [Kiritimatiellia bacterium]
MRARQGRQVVKDSIVIVDYRAGNLTSVRLAFDALGVETSVASDPEKVRAASRVVFPGVGAAAAAMANLRALGLAEAVREAAVAKPFLGICLGMQILFEHSEEDGGVDLLGVLPGRVRRFPGVAGCKVPEIGWNQVNGLSVEGVPDGSEFYFVHSYYAEKGAYTAGVTEYAGIEFTSAVRKGTLLATQFHPEKSGRIGLSLLSSFLTL